MVRPRDHPQDAAESASDEQSQNPKPSSLPNKGFTGTGDHIDDYGDQSTNYWPPCWDFERYRNCKQSDLMSLPRDELVRLLNGFREVLGEEGNLKLARAIGDNEERRKRTAESETATPTLPAAPPGWLRSYQKRFKDQKWGFVIYKTGDYRSQEWDMYKERVNQIMRLQFSKDGRLSGVQEAEALFSLKWLEDDSMRAFGSQQLQEHFARNIKSTIPPGFPDQLFFVATPQSVAQTMQEPIPAADAKRWREHPPYVLAVPAVNQDFEETPAKTFKVALETVVEELWMPLTELSWSAAKVSRQIRETPLVEGQELNIEDPAEDVLPDVWWTSGPSPSSLRKRWRFG